MGGSATGTWGVGKKREESDPPENPASGRVALETSVCTYVGTCKSYFGGVGGAKAAGAECAAGGKHNFRSALQTSHTPDRSDRGAASEAVAGSTWVQKILGCQECLRWIDGKTDRGREEI